MKKIKQYLLSLALIGSLGLVPALAVTSPVGAACQGTNCITEGVKKVDSGSTNGDLTDLVQDIVNILLFIVGAASVIMIVVGGVRYVISSGDQSHVKAAKDTILYAVVGIIVAFLSYALVNFVLDNL